MSVKELEKRVECLETEVKLLSELIRLSSKSQERVTPTYPPTPLNPYYKNEPMLKPPYKITCDKEKHDR